MHYTIELQIIIKVKVVYENDNVTFLVVPHAITLSFCILIMCD
jgi:hypothetical protein